MHVLDMLKERGFIAQVTFEEDSHKALEREPIPSTSASTPRRAARCMVGQPFMPIDRLPVPSSGRATGPSSSAAAAPP